MGKNFVLCEPRKATHIRMLDRRFANLTYGQIYEYQYDENPTEETYYIISDDGTHYYDFECVMKVEYLRQT